MKTQSILSAVLVLATAGTASAATFSTTDFGGSGIDLTIVEVEGFASGGVAGNTVVDGSPGSFWSTAANSSTDNLWRERAVSAFDAGYESLAGATDRTYEISQSERSNGTAPDLITTVSGLAAGNYEVFVVYISGINTAPTAGGDNAATRANLNGSAADGMLYNLANADATITGGANDWNTSIASLGTTGDGATGFTVGLGGESAVGRTHALAVGYRVVPEPGSLALLGLGGLALLRRRRA